MSIFGNTARPKMIVHSPEAPLFNNSMRVMIDIDRIATHIWAITNVSSEQVLKDHSCLNTRATYHRLQHLYDYVCAGGKYDDYGKATK